MSLRKTPRRGAGGLAVPSALLPSLSSASSRPHGESGGPVWQMVDALFDALFDWLLGTLFHLLP